MKLRNKKTGEIIELLAKPSFVKRNDNFLQNEINTFNSLTELNEEWEDYEEPKGYWFIDTSEGAVVEHTEEMFELTDKERKQIGNYFDTREEAEKAVEKLKAWKRLKDKGFRFILDGETEMPMFVYSGANGEKCITSAEESKQCRDDIKLLFGGEE